MLLSTFGKYLLILLSVPSILTKYVPPKALVEPLEPKGIRISIPNESGISLVVFHVKFNNEFMGLEAGTSTIAQDIIRPGNGRWVYEDRTTHLKKGDVVYYWIHVVYEGLGYNLIDQKHVVTKFFEGETTNVQVPGSYVPPEALVEPLSPKGIRISIPDEDGISLVAFHVKFNNEFVRLEAGTIARDIIKPKNGKWTYEDKTMKLKKGDVIHYWIHVVYEGLGYNLIDQKHVVNELFDNDEEKLESGGKNTTPLPEPYNPPGATVELLKPKGIRVSVPNEDGMSLVTVNIKINDEFVGTETGTIAANVFKPKNGVWMYEDKTTKVENGDVIYFRIRVIYKGLSYYSVEQKYEVTGLSDVNKVTTVKPVVTSPTRGISKPYTPPKATVKALKPKGIRVSVPNEDGISLVTVHVKINDEFQGTEAGTIAANITKPENGIWLYQDKSTKLKNGDIIFFRTRVVCKGFSYYTVEQKYVVTELADIDKQTTTVIPTTNVPEPYHPQKAEVKPLKTKGFQVSIPHKDGINLAEFHIKINDEFAEREEGTFIARVIKPKNDKWIFEEKTAKLKKGDVIYYRTRVIFNGREYHTAEQKHLVTAV